MSIVFVRFNPRWPCCMDVFFWIRVIRELFPLVLELRNLEVGWDHIYSSNLSMLVSNNKCYNYIATLLHLTLGIAKA